MMTMLRIKTMTMTRATTMMDEDDQVDPSNNDSTDLIDILSFNDDVDEDEDATMTTTTMTARVMDEDDCVDHSDNGRDPLLQCLR